MLHNSSLMQMESLEAPEVVHRALARNEQAIIEIGKLYRTLRPSHLLTCARGSSDCASGYLSYLAGLVLQIPCCSIGPSLVSVYRSPLRLRDAMLVVISQSGMSPDIAAVQREAKQSGIPTVAITNNPASLVAKEATLNIELHAGPELSVAATKTFIASAALAAAIVAECGGSTTLARAVRKLPEDLRQASQSSWTSVEDAFRGVVSGYIIGRGPFLAAAQEAALKLKETAGIHAEAFSSAELMHGPVELVRDGFPVLVLASRDVGRPETLAAAAKLSQAGAVVVRPSIHETADPFLDPISAIQTFYRSAECISKMRGHDPDSPRLLSKITQTV